MFGCGCLSVVCGLSCGMGVFVRRCLYLGWYVGVYFGYMSVVFGTFVCGECICAMVICL